MVDIVEWIGQIPLSPRLQKAEPSLSILDPSHSGAGDFVDYGFTHQPRTHARSQTAGGRLAGSPQRGMHVEARLPILVRRYHPHPNHLMGAVDWQQHWLRRTFVGSTWANHYLSIPDAANQDHVPHQYAFLLGKALDAVRQSISVLQTYHKNTAQLSFTRFHDALTSQQPDDQV